MSNYPLVEYALKTIFNVETGLSEDVAIRMYLRNAEAGGKTERLKEELRQAFDSSDLSWTEMLRNDSYEVYDAESEADARAFAERILWRPLHD